MLLEVGCSLSVRNTRKAFSGRRCWVLSISVFDGCSCLTCKQGYGHENLGAMWRWPICGSSCCGPEVVGISSSRHLLSDQMLTEWKTDTCAIASEVGL